jgi:hypothetical protein
MMDGDTKSEEERDKELEEWDIWKMLKEGNLNHNEDSSTVSEKKTSYT